MTSVQRPASTLAKLDRMRRALRHEEPDRVPVSDFFWGGFVERWRWELGLPPDADPYRHYDLDWIVTIPNMDPYIKPFEILREDRNEVWVKAGMDVVDLRRRYGHRIGFCGNLDVQKWERGDRGEIRAEVLRKLCAARGGGLILQSDHSVTSGVSGRTYDYVIKLIREHGTYPLDLDESQTP